MTRRGTVVVVAKEPRAGRVKTRLCPPFSATDAACLAEAALRDTLLAVDHTSCRRRVVALDGRTGPWLPPGFEVIAQPTGDLDVRLAAAFAATSGPTVLVGMDTPQLTPALLEHALHVLFAGAGAVLGPACDGGYWLLGLRSPTGHAVLGIPMSTPCTGAAQRERLEGLGLRTVELPTLRDVDTAYDAAEVAALAPATRFAAAYRERTTEPRDPRSAATRARA